jgi:hypothetical protein
MAVRGAPCRRELDEYDRGELRMSWLRKLERDVWALSEKHPIANAITWAAHTALVLLIVVAFGLVGAPWFGYAFGMGYYVVREVEGLLRKGLTAPWWDHVADVLVPAVLGALVAGLVF